MYQEYPLAICRLHWDSREKGHFEELQGPDMVGLPNGLAWDDSHMYHADTHARTITAYEIDADGVPMRHNPDRPVQGKVVVRVADSDGQLLSVSESESL